MQNYEKLIMDKLQGKTPKQKYDYLKEVLLFLEVIAYPKYEEEKVLTTEQLRKLIINLNLISKEIL